MYAHFERGLTLKLTLAEARNASHQGQCAEDVEALSRVPRIASQLAKLDKVAVREELQEYGAWTEEQLIDHEQNLQRILWLAAGDICDQGYERGRS